MAMLHWAGESMTSTTYAGGAGTRILGTSKMGSEGLGAVRLGGTCGLMRKDHAQLLLNTTISLPTGAITEAGRMLTGWGCRWRAAWPIPCSWDWARMI